MQYVRILTRRGDAIVTNVSVTAARTDAIDAQCLSCIVASRGSKKIDNGAKEKIDNAPEEGIRAGSKDEDEEQREIQLHGDDCGGGKAMQ